MEVPQRKERRKQWKTVCTDMRKQERARRAVHT
jgi:hypothetical protein